MIISFLNAKQLGYYAVAFPFFTLLTRTTHSISYIVYPKMLEAYGSSLGEIGSTKRYFEIPSKLNACLVAFGIGLLFLSVKYIFFYLLPQYMEAIPVARILSFAIYFSSLRMLANRVLITQKSYKILFIFYAVAILANILLNFMLIKMGYGIKGVAAATGISYVISCSLSLHYTLSQFYKGLFKIMVNQIKLYWPIFYVGLILLSITKIKFFHVDVIRGLSTDILQLAINLFVFSLLTIPLFILTNRKLIKKIMA
jgi:O-antigen/teichoic acid export membrane protein